MHLMEENHSVFFDLLSKANNNICSYKHGGFYSLMDKKNVFPKLTLCYNELLPKKQYFQEYFRAVEQKEAAPYIILAENENLILAEKLLKQEGFRAVESWTTMSLFTNQVNYVNSTDLHILTVYRAEELQHWLSVVQQGLFNSSNLETTIFEQLLLNNKIQFIIGFAGNEPACALLAVLNESTAGLYMITTLPRFRKKGYASHLVNYALNHFAQKGITRCVLQSTRSGYDMYKHIGFQTDGRFFIYWKIGKEYM